MSGGGPRVHHGETNRKVRKWEALWVRGFKINELFHEVTEENWISSVYLFEKVKPSLLSCWSLDTASPTLKWEYEFYLPESGGEREGSSGLSSSQLGQVLGLELHHHVIKSKQTKLELNWNWKIHHNSSPLHSSNNVQAFSSNLSFVYSYKNCARSCLRDKSSISRSKQTWERRELRLRVILELLLSSPH